MDAELDPFVEQQSVDAWLDAELDDAEQSVGGALLAEALLLDASWARAGTAPSASAVAMIIRVFIGNSSATAFERHRKKFGL